MWILQIADIHLTAGGVTGLEPQKCLELILEAVRHVVATRAKIVVVICGDIIYKGKPSGYQLAQNFFAEMKTLFEYDLSFFLCPGNHDIVPNDHDDYFKHFNMFTWQLTKNEELNFTSSKTVVSGCVNNLDIILVNSAYHGDHTYGEVDIESFEKVLSSAKATEKIIVTHHNAISVSHNDTSTIGNAYEFFQLALSAGANTILHGHGHLENVLLLGKNKCKLVGVSSLFFPLGRNYNNQFNLLKMKRGRVTKIYKYRYIADLHHKGKIGNFQRNDVEFI
jgi:3',5'-cyclic AMP phosphodiesterase CpdA